MIFKEGGHSCPPPALLTHATQSLAWTIAGGCATTGGMNAWNPALEVVNRCLRAGVCEFVVCAGARNAALIEVLTRAEAAGLVRLWRHFEERSAGFFALGARWRPGKRARWSPPAALRRRSCCRR